jgi:hypothetical protein
MDKKDMEVTILQHKIAATGCAGIRARNPEFKALWLRNMNLLQDKLLSVQAQLMLFKNR